MTLIVCDQKQKLLTAYQEATRAYSQAVAQLARSVGASPLAQYDTLNRMAETARIASIAARNALYEHIAEHHC